MFLARRKFLTGMMAALAAPAIVHAASIMPVRSIERFAYLTNSDILALLDAKLDVVEKIMRDALTEDIYRDYSMPLGEKYGMSGAFDLYHAGDRQGDLTHEFHFEYTELGAPVAVRLH